jgi:hypothetical protein
MSISPSPLLVQAHRAATGSPVADIVRVLCDLLTRDLTAYLVGVSDAGTVTRWAAGNVSPRPASEQRLRLAFEIVQLLRSAGSGDETVRAWFLGLNPHLDDVPPAEAIREGQLRETLAAARAFVANSY